MSLHLDKDYNELTLEQRVNACEEARAAGYQHAHSDEDGPFSAGPLDPPSPASDLQIAAVDGTEFLSVIVEPAWQSDEISDEQLEKLSDPELDDPRKDMFERGLKEGRADLAAEIISDEEDQEKQSA